MNISRDINFLNTALIKEYTNAATAIEIFWPSMYAFSVHLLQLSCKISDRIVLIRLFYLCIFCLILPTICLTTLAFISLRLGKNFNISFVLPHCLCDMTLYFFLPKPMLLPRKLSELWLEMTQIYCIYIAWEEKPWTRSAAASNQKIRFFSRVSRVFIFILFQFLEWNYKEYCYLAAFSKIFMWNFKVCRCNHDCYCHCLLHL